MAGAGETVEAEAGMVTDKELEPLPSVTSEQHPDDYRIEMIQRSGS